MVRRNPRPRQHPVQRTGGNGGRDPGVHLCFRRHLHTEADLAEVEALINDETLLHVYLKPCGGEDRRSREGRRIIHHKNAKEIKSLWNTEYVPYIAGIWQSFNPGNSSFKIKAHLVNFEL